MNFKEWTREIGLAELAIHMERLGIEVEVALQLMKLKQRAEKAEADKAELLEALEAVLSKDVIWTDILTQPAIWDNARAAIAKAKGE